MSWASFENGVWAIQRLKPTPTAVSREVSPSGYARLYALRSIGDLMRADLTDRQPLSSTCPACPAVTSGSPGHYDRDPALDIGMGSRTSTP